MARITLVGQRTDWLRLAEIVASAELRVTVCETGGPVLEALTLQSPDLIVVDATLSDLTCAEFLARVRYLEPSLPVIVALTTDSADRLALLEAGAFDLLRTPVEPLEFVTRVHAMLALLARSESPLANPPTTPPSPAKQSSEPFPERTAVIAALDALSTRAAPAISSQALHLVHLGAVADVNAEFGRAIGDRLIESIASALRRAVPVDARVTRVAGDCFAVVDTGTEGIAERIARAAAGPFEIAGERLASTTSIGIARFPRDGRSGEALYRSAMQALLQARASGLDQAIAEAGTDERAAATEPQENAATALARAIGGPDLSLVFQPQVDLTTGDFTALEAFVRWKRPGYGPVAPRELFQIAGTGPLLARLSDEILNLAIAAHETLTHAGFGNLRICLNISATQLSLIAAERGTGTRFVPEERRIEFEIPATLASDGSHLSALTALRVEGFGLCLDLTGTAMPPERPRVAIERVKLDAQDPDRLAAQADFAQSLACPIIGSNIEEAGQLTQLRALGGHAAQGYYIQRPVPLDEFIALARSVLIERGA